MSIKKILFISLNSLFFLLTHTIVDGRPPSCSFNAPMYFATVTDTEHYPWLIILLDSIVEHTKTKEISVAVFDIGLLDNEIKFIESHYKAKVYPLEEVNPDLTKKFVTRSNGRLSRGWYAWKPVAIKQAFDYFPYFLYIDAGKRLVGPCDDIFHAIEEQGYFLFDCGHTIDPMTTKKVKRKFNLNSTKNKWILEQFGVEAGIQGLSRKVYDDYVMPMYLLAQETKWFEDDGTAPWGFGGSRHDQTLFSILARLQNYTVHKVCGDGPRDFFVKGKKVSFNRNDYFQFKQFEDNPRAAEHKLI